MLIAETLKQFLCVYYICLYFIEKEVSLTFAVLLQNLTMLHIQTLVANVQELVLAIKMDEVTMDSVGFKRGNLFAYSQYKHEVDYDDQVDHEM